MKRVAVLPWPDMDNCFLCVSGQKKREEQFGEKWYAKRTPHDENVKDYHPPHMDLCKPVITFVYKENGVAAEWNGEYGPIQLWFECDKDFEDENGYDKAREHWLWPYAHGNGYWSQMAVEEEGLPKCFNQGDYEYIFSALKRWAKSRQ